MWSPSHTRYINIADKNNVMSATANYYTWQGDEETEKPDKVIMNFNQHSDALLVSTNNQGSFTQEYSGFSDNEEDSADFSDLSEEYDPLDSGFYSRKKDCSFIHQTIRTFYMRKSEGFNAFTRNLLDGTLILLNFYFLCAWVNDMCVFLSWVKLFYIKYLKSKNTPALDCSWYIIIHKVQCDLSIVES